MIRTYTYIQCQLISNSEVFLFFCARCPANREKSKRVRCVMKFIIKEGTNNKKWHHNIVLPHLDCDSVLAHLKGTEK